VFREIDDPPLDLIVSLGPCRDVLDSGRVLQLDDQEKLILQTDFEAGDEVGRIISQPRFQIMGNHGKVGDGREVIVEEFIVWSAKV
jgi:hypothetical protein